MTHRRARLLIVGALSVASGALAGRVFGRADATLLGLAAVPSVGIGLVDVFSTRARRALHVLAVVVTAAVATAITGGRVPERTLEGAWRGWSLAISTDWPSPLRAELAAFVAMVVATAGAVSVELVVARRARAGVIVPALLSSLVFLGLSAPAGPPPVPAVVGWLLLAAAVLATGDPARQRLPLLDQFRGEYWSVIPLVVLAGLAATLIVVAPERDRSDPRDGAANPLVTSDELSPLAQVAADRELIEPEDRFIVDGDLVGRWRTRVLDRYDGISWTSSVTVRPVSGDRITEPPDETSVSRQTITAVGVPIVWVPLAGIPVTVDRSAESDADRSMLALEEPIAPGGTVVVETIGGPVRSDVAPGATSRRQPDEESAPFAALAQNLGGSPSTLVARLDNLERSLRDDYLLAPGAAAGTNVALLQFVLENSRRGTPEQFVAAFVLMARSLGAAARIAIGYDVPESGITVTSADSTAWAEVFFEGHGWVAFDPVPVETAANADQGSAPRQAVPADLAPPPPALNPPDADDPELEPTTAAPAARSSVATIVTVGLTVIAGVVLILASAGAVVLLLKARRRRRRLRAERADQLVLGAWAEATDHLVELGADLRAHHTNGEVVAIGARLVASRAHAPLSDLGGLANAAAHGGEQPDPIVAAHAVRLLGQVEQIIGETEPRRRRWRMRLSPRSVRSSSRSPAN